MARPHIGSIEVGIILGLLALTYQRTTLFFVPVPDTKWYPWIWGALSVAAIGLLIFGKRHPAQTGGASAQQEKRLAFLRWLTLGGLVLVIAMRVYVTFRVAHLMREIEQMMLP